ncbi:MAG: ribbon-helix-helix domain-containing protein [Methanomicrobiales archaeon]|nr:ribbon-helix-helix domain-containing protein [Methanomicrobiales archaeon]
MQGYKFRPAMQKKKSTKRSTGFTLTPDLIDRLKKAAREEDSNASALARRAIREFLDRRDGVAA